MIDKQAYLEYLIDTYQNLIFTLCYRKTGNYFEAEDLAQDTFLSAYRALEQFDGKYEKAWLCRIAVNKCLDYAKKAERRTVPQQEILSDATDENGFVEQELMEQEAYAEVKRACLQLRSPYQEVAVAYFCEEHTPQEIAERYGRNLRTVQTQIYRARAQLKKIYGKE